VGEPGLLGYFGHGAGIAPFDIIDAPQIHALALEDAHGATSGLAWLKALISSMAGEGAARPNLTGCVRGSALAWCSDWVFTP